MSDESVDKALRSSARLVVIEAPAGCGKTHQGADYAQHLAASELRPLILTHTHAACSVFAARTAGARRATIRTIDSLIAEVAATYHGGIDLPPDIPAWLRQHNNGYRQLALRVACLLDRHPMIARTLAARHPVIICDEHQDSSGDQHSVLMALHAAGARLRLFADPMQAIFSNPPLPASHPVCDWSALVDAADGHEQLDYPHRWTNGCTQLGEWILAARDALKDGRPIDLRSRLPPSVRVIVAENQAQANGDYRLPAGDQQRIHAFADAERSLLVLTHRNDTALSLRSFFYRRIPLWEGHTRPSLDSLASDLSMATGDPSAVATAVVQFLGSVAKGLSWSAFGNALIEEVRSGCTARRRGKPERIQSLARHLLEDPSHRGVAQMLEHLSGLLHSRDRAFKAVAIDCRSELRDAIRLGAFDTPDEGLTELATRRAYARPKPPVRAISTIHKAKGLECETVILVPCDRKTFPDNQSARRLLYVALSRATTRLMLVLSRRNPSPLFAI